MFSCFLHLRLRIGRALCSAGVLLFLFGPGKWAAASPDERPVLPLIRKTPDAASWTITVQQKQPRSPKSPDPKQEAYLEMVARVNPRMMQQVVEKLGDTLHRETDWEDGGKDVYWFYQGNVVFQQRHFRPDQVLLMPANAIGAPQRPKNDFPELDWIGLDNFSEVTTYQDEKSYLYTKTLPDMSTLSAWIDFKTKLPLAVEDKTTLKTYTFGPGPTSLQPEGIFAYRPKPLPKPPVEPAPAFVP